MLRCTNCTAEWPDDHVFCGDCGTRLEAHAPESDPGRGTRLACPACGTEHPSDTRFCTECGAAMTAPPALGAVTEVVTPLSTRATPASAESEWAPPLANTTLVPERPGGRGLGPEPPVIPGPGTEPVISPDAGRSAQALTTAPSEREPASTAESVVKCSACGAPVVPGTRFCLECGTAIAESMPAPDSPPSVDDPRATSPSHLEAAGISNAASTSVSAPVSVDAAWEYTHVKASTMNLNGLIQALNQLGADGWELVGFASADKTIGLNSLIALMKRPYRRLPLPADTTKGWKPDPSGRHPDRYWDGNRWTRWVRDQPGGTRAEDPLNL